MRKKPDEDKRNLDDDGTGSEGDFMSEAKVEWDLCHFEAWFYISRIGLGNLFQGKLELEEFL